LFSNQPADVCAKAVTQGDVWDAQKDIAFAMIGSIIALFLHNLWGSKTHKVDT